MSMSVGSADGDEDEEIGGFTWGLTIFFSLVLAVVPSTFSVLCLVLAHRSRQARFVFAAELPEALLD